MGTHADDPHEAASDDPVLFWESRYAESGQVWSGRVNRSLMGVAAELPVGRALDLGCGEGGDSIWLAERGWTVTGVDISATAVHRADRFARDRGLGTDRIRFTAADLGSWSTEQRFDLVSACFLQSPVTLPRADILRAVLPLVDPGGTVVIISHAAPPPWSRLQHGGHVFLTPDQEISALELSDAWTVVTAEVRSRDATGPDHERAVLDDTVVVVRRNRSES